MWNLEIQKGTDTEKAGKQIQKCFLSGSSGRLSCKNVIQLWQHSDEFNEWFSSELVSNSAKAVRWETPCLTRQDIGRDFEFVLVDSPRLDRPADQAPFANKFVSAEPNSVIAFPNLGRNAIMVVPTPGVDHTIYCHLLSFLRGGTKKQRNLLWQLVGEQMEIRVNDTPVWLSTAGGGVAWLHVRLDDQPKYYSYAPYRKSARDSHDR